MSWVRLHSGHQTTVRTSATQRRNTRMHRPRISDRATTAIEPRGRPAGNKNVRYYFLVTTIKYCRTTRHPRCQAAATADRLTPLSQSNNMPRFGRETDRPPRINGKDSPPQPSVRLLRSVACLPFTSLGSLAALATAAVSVIIANSPRQVHTDAQYSG